MAMVKKSISITSQQERWLKTQIKTGHYGNDSEVFRELIRERVHRDQETEQIQAALVQGEKSGISHKTVDEIWKEAEQHYKTKHA